MKKTGFYLMGLKGLSCLKAIAGESDSSILDSVSFIVAARDKSIQNDYFELIRLLAKSRQLLFYEKSQAPENLVADFIFAIGWRWLIHGSEDRLIVFHDSILPKYRGFNPLVTALIEGDRQIGVTAILANREFDRGNIIGVKKTSIGYPLKIEKAINLVSELYADLLIETLGLLQAETVTGTAQEETMASYSLWRSDEDYQVDWTQDASRIRRFVDAVGYPYNGAVTSYNSETIRIIDVAEKDDLQIVNRQPGKFIFIENNKPVVVCGTGLLQIEKAVSLEGAHNISFGKLRTRLK